MATEWGPPWTKGLAVPLVGGVTGSFAVVRWTSPSGTLAWLVGLTAVELGRGTGAGGAFKLLAVSSIVPVILQEPLHHAGVP